MPKSRSPSDKTIERWLKMGLGQGTGLDYCPFFYVRDVPSRGRSTIVEGLKLKRKHHYLSDIEYAYHVLAEFSPSVVEIREQYALLPREETLQIARDLGVSHPVYNGSGALRVQTSDLVLTLANDCVQSFHVLCCKAASDIEPTNPEAVRTLEKILIEKIFWERRNIPWTLATDAMIPKTKYRNLEFFRSTMVARELDHLSTKMPEFLRIFREQWTSEHTLNDLLNITSSKLAINVDHSFCLLGRAIWTKLLNIDLDSVLIKHDVSFPEF